MRIDTDCAIVGAGFAGCSAALELADAGVRVDLFHKGSWPSESSSRLTAGGLSAVSAREMTAHRDSYERHVADTLAAGAGLNDERVVRLCVERFYPDVIEWLIAQGVRFDGREGACDLHREGGHQANRVFHVGDETGVHVMEVLSRRVRSHPNIRVHENHVAVDLVTRRRSLKESGPDACLGLYAHDAREHRVTAVTARAVFLATGGLGKVFLYTSNPDSASGDGFAMAWRAGVPLVNMEFIQFHPTVFFDEEAEPSERRFLFTEALRGEGAFLKLRRDDADDFVLRHHPLGSKATRDITTRAEDLEMRRNDLKHVWLDCTRIPPERLKTGFASAWEFAHRKGYDLSRDPVPVVYAVHYSNGGIATDANGATELPGLYALGETAYTGLHGATRLASNSAPECLFFGRRAARHFLESRREVPLLAVPDWDTGRATETKDPGTVRGYWELTRKTMTVLCGIARTDTRLLAAQDVIGALERNIRSYYWSYHVTPEFLEARNLADVAHVVLESALARRESRACHYREDFPETDDRYRGLTVVRRGQPAGIRPL